MRSICSFGGFFVFFVICVHCHKLLRTVLYHIFQSFKSCMNFKLSIDITAFFFF